MVSKEKLYEAFGELVYAVAKADGAVQAEEIQALHTLLSTHSWAQDIEWSFNYEKSRNHSVEETYKKSLDIFQEHGPDPEYARFIEVLELVAAAFNGTSQAEQKVIDDFKQQLLEKFKNDLSLIGYDEEG